MAKNLSSNLGYFITFEGPDGCGKTTIAKEVFKILEKQYPVGRNTKIWRDIFGENTKFRKTNLHNKKRKVL